MVEVQTEKVAFEVPAPFSGTLIEIKVKRGETAKTGAVIAMAENYNQTYNMTNFRSRPKANYINEADWQELYVLTEHWKSDLSFYSDDLKFCIILLTNILFGSQKENIDMVREIEVGLNNMDNQCGFLLDRANKHLHHLTELIDNPFAYDSHKFRAEHEQLEDDLTSFVKDFRKNRKEVFTITKYVVDTEKFVQKIMNE